MYGRIISFTLLAPSLWTVVEAIGSIKNDINHKRFLFKSAENAGFIVEIFTDRKIAGLKLETIKVNTDHDSVCFPTINYREWPICSNNCYHPITWKNVLAGFVNF